jgi:hypothetical protein
VDLFFKNNAWLQNTGLDLGNSLIIMHVLALEYDFLTIWKKMYFLSFKQAENV